MRDSRRSVQKLRSFFRKTKLETAYLFELEAQLPLETHRFGETCFILDPTWPVQGGAGQVRSPQRFAGRVSTFLAGGRACGGFG